MLDKSCREYKSKHFISSNFFFSKIVPCSRHCGQNVLELDRPQIIINYGTDDVICVPHN